MATSGYCGGVRKSNKPELLEAEVFIDARGALTHFGSAEFLARRMYFIRPEISAGLRGWHGHKDEAKLFLCISGEIRLSCARVLDWEIGSSEAPEEFVIRGNSRSAVFVPRGYANAIEPLSGTSEVLVLSDKCLSDSLMDDFRFTHLQRNDGS